MYRSLGLALLAVGAASLANAGGAVHPADLKTEYRVDPAGIGETQPRFTWILTGEGKNLMQSAYQILVADSAEALAKNEGNLWDSGKIESRESILIAYAGKPLTSRMHCQWKVKVWDQKGEASDWSLPAKFSMGLLDPADWSAQWIGYDTPAKDETTFRDPMAEAHWIWYPEGDPAVSVPDGAVRWFRKSFDLPKDDAVKSAILHISADNTAKANLNGQRLGKGLEPIESHSRRCEYPTTEFLKPGKNVLAIEGGNNHGCAGVIASLAITFASGKTLAIPTDDTWKAMNEKPRKGWDDVKFKEKKWVDAKVVADYGKSPWGYVYGKEMVLPAPPILRHEFQAVKPIRRATVYASAFGIYELSINGERVGRDYFTPGWCEYKKRVYYNTYDVTSLIKPGTANALGAILADGWYAGHVGLKGRGFYGDKPRFMAQLELEYEDGSTDRVVTDGSWKAGYGEVREADLLMGETRDFNKAQPGWNMPGFNDAAWDSVVTAAPGEITALVQPYPGDPVRAFETLTAKKMTEPKPGVFVYDLGQNMVGWAKFTVNGKAGDRIVVRQAEMLQPEDGMLYTVALRSARAIDTYVLAKDGRITLEPNFTFHGFRYVEISGVSEAPALEEVQGIVLRSNIPRTAFFEASDPLLTQLAQNIVWGQRGNYLEAPTDCPQRDERLGWTGDAQFFMPTALYTADIGAFHTKWLVDLIDDSQHADGSFAHVAPDMNIGGGAVAWGDAAIICPYLMYRFYGDTRIIERHYDAMVKGMAFFENTSENFIRKDLGFGDWVNLGGGAKDEVICTAYYAYLAQIMAEMAVVIGKADDAARFSALHDNIRNAFIAAFVDKDGRILESSQTGYALAFAFDLLPKEVRAAAADRFVEEIAKFDWHLATGFIGTPRLLPALTQAGREDVAYRLLMNTTFPSWLYQVKLGSTTMWERWNGWTPETGFADPGMNSFNHYAFGAVGEYIYDHVAGILPGDIGFRNVILRPRPGGGLTSAKLAYRSIRGTIVSDWALIDGKMRLSVEVPPNVTATVCLPVAALNDVTVDGKPIENARIERGEMRCDIGSGKYTFEAPYTAPAPMK